MVNSAGDRLKVRTYAPSLSSIPDSRHWATPILSKWLEPSHPVDAILVLSELVTNAVTHGAGPLTIRLRRMDKGVRIEVTDDGVDAVVRQLVASHADHGRGVDIVARLSDSWGVEPHPPGKTVWAELPDPRRWE